MRFAFMQIDRANRMTFDRGASPTKLKVGCRIAKTIAGKIESSVEDPRQPALLRLLRVARDQLLIRAMPLP